MAEFRATKIAEIRAQLGDRRVLCGLSRGVDSAVATVLIHEALGEQLTCVFVDHGLLRLNEREQAARLLRAHYNIPLVVVDEHERFMAVPAGVHHTEKKSNAIDGATQHIIREANT